MLQPSMAKEPKSERAHPFAALAGLELPPGPAIDAPAREEHEVLFAPKVVVSRETKGRGGKTVTRVRGIAAQKEELARAMKKDLGCGATFEGDDLVLLGSLVDRAAEWLAARGAKKVVRSA